MKNTFAGMDLITVLIFSGLFATTTLLALALAAKWSGGLFFSRMPQQFQKDRNDPRFELERRTGQAYSRFVLKYVPPFFIGFLLLSLWLLIFK